MSRPVPAPDRDALAALAAASLTRDQLRAGGWVAVSKNADLHRHGYNIVLWFQIGIVDGAAAITAIGFEYLSRWAAGAADRPPELAGGVPAALPRVFVTRYADQVKVHRALGIAVVAPGALWGERDARQPSLFDYAAPQEN